MDCHPCPFWMAGTTGKYIKKKKNLHNHCGSVTVRLPPKTYIVPNFHVKIRNHWCRAVAHSVPARDKLNSFINLVFLLKKNSMWF